MAALVRVLAPILCYNPLGDLVKIGAGTIMEKTLRFTVYHTRRAWTRGCVAVVRMVFAGVLVVRSIVTSVKITVVSAYSGVLSGSAVVARGAMLSSSGSAPAERGPL